MLQNLDVIEKSGCQNRIQRQKNIDIDHSHQLCILKKNVLQCSVIFYLLVIIKKYILRSIVYFVLFCMKLGHHKSRKVTELDF